MKLSKLAFICFGSCGHLRNYRRGAMSVSEQIPPQLARVGPERPDSWEIPSGLRRSGTGSPLMQCRCPMLYQGADGPCNPRRDRPEPQIRMQLRMQCLHV